MSLGAQPLIYIDGVRVQNDATLGPSTGVASNASAIGATRQRRRSHTANGRDYAITTAAGTVTTSARQLADALRARMLYSRRGAGDLAAAAAIAAGVSDGFMAYILREEGEKRRNMVASFHGNGGGVQAAGFLQGPVKLKTPANSYGISEFGSHPNGTAWPDSLPFTGYIDLSIDPATGRAVGDDGYPLTLGEDAGSVIDTRVTHAIGNTAGGDDFIETKYTSLSDDIPLANWREMRLIQAEAAGPGAAATALVNSIRQADNLPEIAGAYLTLVESDADRFRDMLIEERRRSLWLEARFWTTKIIYNELLWFPRAVGDLVNPGATYSLGGGVRQLMATNEYNINSNFDLSARGTGCAAFEAPVGF